MFPFVKPSFWLEREFEEAAPEMKLALLWIMTNPGTSSAGVFQKSPRRFTFETNLPADWLEKTLAQYPEKFFIHDDLVLIRSYIRHQYGAGETLAKNNMAKALRKGLQALPTSFQNEIFRLHPELKPFQSPSQGLVHSRNPLNTGDSNSQNSDSTFSREGLQKPQGRYGGREREISTVVNGTEPEEKTALPPSAPFAETPSLAEVKTAASMMGMTERDAEAFFNHYDGLGWMHGSTPIRNWRSWLPKWRDRSREFSAQKKNAPRPDAEELRRIDAELDWQTDPKRIEFLKKRRRELEDGGAKA